VFGSTKTVTSRLSNKEDKMLDPKVFVGAAITLSAGANSWIDQAQSYGQLMVTGIGVVVGILTVWYTVERIRKLRHERKDDE